MSIAVFLLCAGPVVASFMAAYADRLVSGRDPVAAPALCDACGARIAARDRVPILSWIGLGGRCRACRAPIPRRLFVAELAGLALAALALWITRDAGQPLVTAATALHLWLLLGLALSDLGALRLPDPLTGALALTGLGLAWLDPARTGAGGALAGLGLAAVFCGLRAAFRRLRGVEGLGPGDVKMAFGLGAGAGALALPWLVLVAALGGLAYAALTRTARDTPLPFGACLAGAGVVVMVADRLVQ